MTSRLDIDLRDENILEDFRDFVKQKYKGKFKKFYGFEIKNALKFYLAAHNYENYMSLIESEDSLQYLSLGSPMHTHPKPVFDQRSLYFIIKFFKKFHKEDKIKVEALNKFIKSTLIISDNRAVKNWRIFLCDIKWVKAWATEGWDILMDEKSLYKLLGEDPTGTYDPKNEYINEASSIFKARTASDEISKASIKRF